jgi:hypothetical protein
MSSSFRHYPMPEEQPHPFSKNYRLIGPSFRPDPFSICLPFEQAHAVMSKTMCLLADDGSQRHHVLPNGGKGVGRAACSFNIITPMPEVNSACDKTRPHPDSETPFMRVAHKLNIHVKIQAPGFAEVSLEFAGSIR